MAEDLERLFPKCRPPRVGDFNHNLRTDGEGNVLELAGGREVFSRSRLSRGKRLVTLANNNRASDSDSGDSSAAYETVVENDEVGGDLKVLALSPRSGSPVDHSASSFCDVGCSPVDGLPPPSPEPPAERKPRVIGNLPIAEYDESPKRYGPRHGPGLPQRVSDAEFGELEYRLYRVSAAVGRRLAEPYQTELLLLHERVHQLNGAGLSPPESTSSTEPPPGDDDVESVASLDGLNTAAMPVLEDGLSSGHSSEDDMVDDRPASGETSPVTVDQAIQEIKQAIQRSKSVHLQSPPSPPPPPQPVWLPRLSAEGVPSGDEDEPPGPPEDCDTDQETDRLLGAQRDTDQPRPGGCKRQGSNGKKKNTSKEVLIEGVLFRARYLGSTLLVCEGQPTKATRMLQAEEAVTRIKSLAPEGESQPRTEIDLFISTEKIMVLNTDLKEIMMDHALRTISYIADIGDLVVLMARRRLLEDVDKVKPQPPKMICHVFESEEAQFIAQSIGQAFQVAYMEFLKANGIEDSSFVREMDYQEVLNSQQIFGNELEMFAKKEKQKEVVVPKQKGEILGLVIVESGWGSMLPTVVVANMAQASPAARCGHLNIGDQIIAINGVSLVGLPLSTCQNYIKNTKGQTVVKLTVVPCAPVVEVKIKRPDTKYQLGFSVQNGVICSLLRGGIAERGGVRVGHRIIEINGQSVVAVQHEKIVNLLATSVGEINMKTMPTSMFRLLTGQETPVFM